MPPAFDGAVVLGASKGGNFDTLKEFATVDCVPLRDCVSFAAVYHFCQGVSARGIEQPIKRLRMVGLHRDKRFRDQTRNRLGDLLPLEDIPCSDKLRGLKRKSPDE